MIRASIFAQIPLKNSGNAATSTTNSNITLSNGLAVTGNNSFTTNEFQFANTDGLGILEFYFGDVATAANDQIMKIETVDYKSFKNTGSWGDMLFKTNASNQFCGVFNNNSNDLIKVFDNGWNNGQRVFLHDTTTYNVNPTGYGDSSGGGPGGTPIGHFQNKLPQARAASGILHAWNAANANHSPSNGFLSLHYLNLGHV